MTAAPPITAPAAAELTPIPLAEREGAFVLAFPTSPPTEVPIPWATTYDAASGVASRVGHDFRAGAFVPGLTPVDRYDDGEGAPFALPLFELVTAVLLGAPKPLPPAMRDVKDAAYAFMGAFGRYASAAAVTSADVAAFVREPASVAERRRRHAALVALFGAFARERWIASDPALAVPKP